MYLEFSFSLSAEFKISEQLMNVTFNNSRGKHVIHKQKLGTWAEFMHHELQNTLSHTKDNYSICISKFDSKGTCAHMP